MYSTGFSRGSHPVLLLWSGNVCWALLRSTCEIFAVQPRAPGYTVSLSAVSSYPCLSSQHSLGPTLFENASFPVAILLFVSIGTQPISIANPNTDTLLTYCATSRVICRQNCLAESNKVL